uniref:Uncharacterized protein n=1 Tax=Octopus bimaculoides TaxID=37653 RepID=A0A0L8HPM0_OCTBM
MAISPLLLLQEYLLYMLCLKCLECIILFFFFIFSFFVSLTGHCYICSFWWYKFRLDASVCMRRLVVGTKVYILEIISNIYPIILRLQ